MSDLAQSCRATAEDDAALQALHSAVAVPGRIGLRFSRKPSFFAGPEALGKFDALIVRENSAERTGRAPGGLLEGMLSRSVRPVFVGGAVEEVAFINHLRLRPGCRSIAVLRRLCAELYDLQRAQPTALTLATISSGNSTALGILVERPLKSFPRLFPIGELITFSIPAPLRIKREMPQPFRTAAAGRPFDILPAAKQKNFFPAIERWSWEALRDHGLLPEHLLSMDELDTTVFHAALWDQSASKQVEVTYLSPALSAVRPLYNALCCLRGRGGIPGQGEPLKVLSLNFLGAKDNDPEIFRRAIPGLVQQTRLRGCDQFVVTLSARDPLAAAARRFASMSYRSTVYTVAFDHSPPAPSLMKNLCHLDAGFL